MNHIEFKYDDGGRCECGYRGSTGDCGVRALAIATGKPYNEVYQRLYNEQQKFLQNKRAKRYKKSRPSPRNGVWREVMNAVASSWNFEWVSTMKIGQGMTVHVREDELPKGTLILRLSKHYACVIDGVLYDTYDCSREGTRGVYGYWKKKEEEKGMDVKII